MARSQLFNAYLVQRIALCAPSARRASYLHCFCVELGILYRKRNEPDTLGFFAQHLVAQQQMVFGLGQTA